MVRVGRPPNIHLPLIAPTDRTARRYSRTSPRCDREAGAVRGGEHHRQHDLRGTAGAEPANPNSHKMAEETRLERRLDRAVNRATTPRGAAIVIASVSTVITVLAGLLVTVVEHDTYPSIGTGLWWAAQTVTTVGYGDNVPTSLAGRLVAVFVMFVGIGFLTVVTAAITSTFVAHARRVDETSSDVETAMVVDQLRQLDSRLQRIEAALDRSSSP
jgi:voltage-gated potassium channel